MGSTYDIRSDAVNGVPVRWIDAPPPYVATLTFRVGPIDEELKTSGITHLTEHLALDPLHDRHHTLNGAVHLDMTQFWAIGTRDQTTTFLNDLSRSLARLDTSRLEAEARVLAAESHIKHPSIFNELLATWFGPNGPGLTGMGEYGLEWLGAAHVGAWAARYFTAENAILTLTGPPDPDLRLALARGVRASTPDLPESAGFQPNEPTLLATQNNGICLGTLVSRSVPILMALDIAERRLREDLRHDRGLVYAVFVSYYPVSADEAFVFLATEFEPHLADEASRRFMRILENLAEHGPTETELDTARRDPVHETIDPVAFARSELNRLAHDELAGHPIVTRAEAREIRNHTTAAEVEEAFATMMERVLVVGPESLDRSLATRPRLSHTPYRGKTYRARLGSDSGMKRIVVGTDGVSGYAEGRWVSIPFRELVLVTQPEPEVRRLFSRTGSWMEVGARAWRRGGDLIRRLDEHVPSGSLLPQRRTVG